MAGWFGLATGLVEASLLVFRHLVLHQFIWSSKHIMWMAPAAYVWFFAAPVAVLAAVAWAFPRLARPWWVAGVAAACTFVGGACFLRVLSLQRIHIAAIVLFAAGLGVHVARIFIDPARHPLAFVRRTIPWLALVVVLVGVSTTVWWRRSERRAIAALPQPAVGSPNVLLLILDTVRAASLGLYGYARPTTPELERFARRGVVFDRAMTAVPWTLTSHAVMFTGRLPHELSTNFLSPLDARFPTLAEIFGRNGYLTAGFVANNFYCSYQSGLNRGFTHYEDFPITPRQVLFSGELGDWLSGRYNKLILRGNDRKPAARIDADFLRWASGTGGRPFFAFLNYMEAHQPYHTPEVFSRKFGGSGSSKTDKYDASIGYLDAELGNLFRELEARGLLANTIVIVAADHGEQLGEHGLDDHGNSLYLQLLHVPLVIVQPGAVPADRRVADPVSLRDLPATILSLARLPPELPGRSLERLWTGAGGGGADSLLLAEVERRPTGPSVWPNRKGPMRALLAGPYHYIRESDGREQLFDYWRDPSEEHDLAGSDQGPTLLDRFRAALAHM